MEGHLKLSAKDREHLKVFERVKRGELQQNEAVAGVSARVSLSAAVVQTLLRARRSLLSASRTWAAVEPSALSRVQTRRC